MAQAYRLGKRGEAADETRERVLEAATELLIASGFHPVSVEAVAIRAGTSRPTVYRYFGTKLGLFEAVAWKMLAAAGLERIDDARQLADARMALRTFLRENCRMFAKVGEGLRALDAARDEPAVAKILDLTYYGRRIESLQHLAARLRDEGVLKTGWTADEAVDALMVLTSAEVCEALTKHRGRTSNEAADRLIEMSTSFAEV